MYGISGEKKNSNCYYKSGIGRYQDEWMDEWKCLSLFKKKSIQGEPFGLQLYWDMKVNIF